MMRSNERPRTQNQQQDPIIDALYDRCVQFLSVCDKDDHRAKRRLFGSIQEFWYQRYMAGERLPMPPITLDQLLTTDDYYIDQATNWVSSIMRQIEAKRGVAYVG